MYTKPLRTVQIGIVAICASYALLVAIGNIADYNSNFAFVAHVLSMDTTFEGNSLMWRAITDERVHHLAYWSIIAAEAATGLLCLLGAVQMLRHRNSSKNCYLSAKSLALLGLLIGLATWFFGFIVIGSEWFAMWQSEVWNGKDTAFSVSTLLALSLLIVMQPDQSA